MTFDLDSTSVPAPAPASGPSAPYKSVMPNTSSSSQPSSAPATSTSLGMPAGLLTCRTTTQSGRCSSSVLCLCLLHSLLTFDVECIVLLTVDVCCVPSNSSLTSLTMYVSIPGAGQQRTVLTLPHPVVPAHMPLLTPLQSLIAPLSVCSLTCRILYELRLATIKGDQKATGAVVLSQVGESSSYEGLLGQLYTIDYHSDS